MSPSDEMTEGEGAIFQAIGKIVVWGIVTFFISYLCAVVIGGSGIFANKPHPFGEGGELLCANRALGFAMLLLVYLKIQVISHKVDLANAKCSLAVKEQMLSELRKQLREFTDDEENA